MGVLGSSCGDTERTYFFRSVGDSRDVVLVAAVIHRGTQSGWKRESLISVLGRAMFGRRPKASTSPALPPHEDWTSSSGVGGEVCYSEPRRIVRVVGKDFSLPPDDRTLIVLVHEGADGPAAARTSTSVIRVPARAGRPQHSGRDRDDIARAMGEWMRANQEAWDAAVDADEVVREFQRAHRAGGDDVTG